MNMKQNIECEIAQTEGSLIRVLGVVERRGYTLHALRVRPVGPDAFQLSFCIESSRDAAILIRQLERLFDVRDVYLAANGSTAPETSVPSGPMPGFQASWLAG
jgi:acetolactate synthase regulatory subunit